MPKNDHPSGKLKPRIGLFLGPALFVLIVNLPVGSMTQLAALRAVLNHSDAQVVREVEARTGAASWQEIREQQVQLLLAGVQDLRVAIPADFIKSGQQGIQLKPQEGKPLPDVVEQQARALRVVLAVLAWMAVWWISECVPIPVTSLLPMLLFPLFSVSHYSAARFPGYFVVYTPYIENLIVLFMGGFMIAEAIKKWNLHRRIALWIMKAIGLSPSRLVLGLMVATAFISMFVSNTATAAMMMPIGLAILLESKVPLGQSRFGLAVMLGIAYGSSLGGIATLIGTPPNLVLAGFASKFDLTEITFSNWLSVGLPFTVVYLPLVWWMLTRVLARPEMRHLEDARETLDRKLRELGAPGWPEKATLGVAIMVAVLWITRSRITITRAGATPFVIPGWGDISSLAWADDSVVAIFGVLLLFVIPASWKKMEFLLDWKSAGQIPWDILLLFGGGLCLGKAMDNTGAADYLALYLRVLEPVHPVVILFAVTLAVNFLTEVTSNTATATMLMPVLYATGVAIGIEPLGLMMAGAGAASMAFMLPVATPPNAIVYGTGYIRMNQMVRIGILMNLTSTLLWASWLYLGVSRFFPGVRF